MDLVTNNFCGNNNNNNNNNRATEERNHVKNNEMQFILFIHFGMCLCVCAHGASIAATGETAMVMTTTNDIACLTCGIPTKKHPFNSSNRSHPKRMQKAIGANNYVIEDAAAAAAAAVVDTHKKIVHIEHI